MENFKNKFIEIKDEIKNLNPNNESITDSIIAPIFFVVSANFLELNQAIYSTAALLSAIVFYRVFKKQNLNSGENSLANFLGDFNFGAYTVVPYTFPKETFSVII